MWKAFAEMETLGWIGSARPRMFSVQASGCAPIVRAFEAGEASAAELARYAALARYVEQGGHLGLFAFIPNELLTTDADWAERCRAILRENLAGHCKAHYARLEVIDVADLLVGCNAGWQNERPA